VAAGEPLRHRRRPRLGVFYVARGLFHAGIHREDMDQASGLQHPAHRLLAGGQGQVTAASPSPLPYSQQHRQAAVADAHLDIDKQGFAWLPEDDFVHYFAGDIDPVTARVMYAVQQPLAATALQDVMGVPAWKSHPSWFLVAANDQAIPPDAERQFAKRMGATTVEVPSGHVAMVSHPRRREAAHRDRRQSCRGRQPTAYAQPASGASRLGAGAMGQ